jgi:hypothetical protein
VNKVTRWLMTLFGSTFLALTDLALAQTTSPPLVEFATKDFGWMLASEVQFQEKLGAIAFRGDRVGGNQDDREFYTDRNIRKFDRWCGKQGGKVTYESGDTVIGKTAGFLWPTPASRKDESWVCKSKDGTTVAAVLRGAPQEVDVAYWGGGKVPGYEFRYAIFDGPSWEGLPARRDAAWAAYQERRREGAAALAAAEKADNEKWERETARLRSDPKVGDNTSLGMIVEVKPPLVLVQVSPDRREARGASQEWVKMENLWAPRR